MAPEGPACHAPAAVCPTRVLCAAAGGAAGEREQPVESDERSSQLRAISLEYQARELSEATQGWSLGRKLGAGRAGAVYRGELRDGTEVAIKLIEHGGPNKKASGFHDEVQMLSKFRHPNLVTLLGWAKDEDARYLVYELLSGGDLFQRLVRSRRAASQPFTWQERLSVCLDAATGLSHLHNSTPQAFHRDVKSANIVLSGSGTAKMADFGLSCTAGPLEAATLRAVCGTPGYLCPLYKATGRMSEGSEVYSFGMVMLEVLTGLSPSSNDPAAPGGLAYPIARSIMPQQAGALERCMQGLDRGAAWPTEEARGFCDHALRCVAAEKQERPCFADTVRALRCMARAAAAAGTPGGRALVQRQRSAAAEQGVAAAAAPVRPAAPTAPRRAPLGAEHAASQAVLRLSSAGHCPLGSPSPGAAPLWAAAAPAPEEGLSAVPAWALEHVSSKGASTDELSPSQRTLLLRPGVGAEGAELVAAVGRVHQPDLFRAWLPDAKERYAVSRLAFEVSWPPGGGAWLRARSTNPVYVDGHRAQPGKPAMLTPGSEVLLVFEQSVLVKLRFCACGGPTESEVTVAPPAAARSAEVPASAAPETVALQGLPQHAAAAAPSAPRPLREGPLGGAARDPPACSALGRAASAGDALMMTSKGLDQSWGADQPEELARVLDGTLLEDESECSTSSSEEEADEAPVASKGTNSTGSTGSIARPSARPVFSPQGSEGPDEAEPGQTSGPMSTDIDAPAQRAVRPPGPEAAGFLPPGSAQQPPAAARADQQPSAREAGAHPAQQPAAARPGLQLSATAHRASVGPASARVEVLQPQRASLHELQTRSLPAPSVAVAPMVMLELHGEGVLPVPQGQRRIGPLRLEPGQWLHVGRARQPEVLGACVAPGCLESLEPESFGLQVRGGQALLLALAAGPVWREQPGRTSVRLSREVAVPAASGDVVTVSYTTGAGLRRGPSWLVSLLCVM